MLATILVVLDDPKIGEESIRCGLELAKRLASRVEVLVLGEAPGATTAELDGFAALAQVARDEGVDLSIHRRSGDKTSELLKYLASQAHVRALVWGGDDAALSVTSSSRRRHWFGRMRERVECPIVTASRKRSIAKRSEGSEN